MKKNEQLELEIPASENEPKPWFYRVWRFMSYEDYYCLTKEEAYEMCISRIQIDLDEWVEGIFAPDGTFVERPDY